MEELGWASIRVMPSLKGFDSASLERGVGPGVARAGVTSGEKFGSEFSTRARDTIHDKFRETAKYIIGPLVGAFAIEKIGDILKESISAASDLAAAQNRSKLIFGDSSEEVDRFAEHAAKAYGLSASQAEGAATQFGILFKNSKASNDQSAKYSVTLTKLTADLAEFGHTDTTSAATALARGLQGSTRTLKQYGVILDDNSIKAEALAKGIVKPVKDQAKIHSAQVTVLKDQTAYNDALAKYGKGSLQAQSAQATLGSAQEAFNKATAGSVPELTAQQKILAAYPLILAQTKTQQGQFSRSQGDLVVQQRKLSAEWSNAKDRLGKGLLPEVTAFVRFVNDKGVPQLDRFSHWFEHDGAKSIDNFIGDAKPLANSILPAMATGFGDVAGFLKDAAPYAKKTIDAFNSLPAWAQKAIVLGAGAAYVGKKTGLLSVGAKALTGGGSGAGGILSATRGTPENPMYVIDLNGVGGVGGGGGKVPPVVAGGVKAGEAAGAEAEAARAAKAAAAAVKAAGGGTAAESAAAARAFKEAMAAHDAAVLKEALSFGIKGGLLRTVLSPVAGITLADAGAEQKQLNPVTGIGKLPPDIKAGPGAGAKSWAELDKTFTHLVSKGGILSVSDQLHTLALQAAAIKGSSNPSVGFKDLDQLLPKTEAKIDRLTGGTDIAGRSFRQLGQGAHSTLDQVTSATSILDAKLRGLPKSFVTKLKLDTSDADRDLDRFRTHAGRHISTELSIDLVGRSPQQTALDGVRRRP